MAMASLLLEEVAAAARAVVEADWVCGSKNWRGEDVRV
jgi:hypothetical protein